MIARQLADVAALAHGTLVPDTGTTSPAAISAVVTDSRQVGPGTLFVALAGQRTDGHSHVGAAATAGAAAALVSDVAAARACLAAAGTQLPLIAVPDTVAALGALARGHLADLRQRAAQRGTALTVVAVTGSVGKTTTKDLVRQLLAAQAPTVAPVASFNNEIGLPLTVLQTDADTRYLVLEMGASAPGHIAYLTDIAPLDAAGVLMIGHAHMEGFGSIEGVARAKSEIVRGLLPTGTAVLNHDDARAAAMADLAPAHLTFSAAGSPDADIRATDVVLDADAHAVFNLHLPGLSVPERVRLAIPGGHNVSNALAAAGLALAAGADPAAVASRLATVTVESPHRMDVSLREGNLLLIDDAYNANIDSMTAAMRALDTLGDDRRRVAIISEMLELGESSVADHTRTGELAAAAGVQLLITVGAGAAPTAAAARRRGVEVYELPDADAALALMDSTDNPLRDGDVVLVKGSNGSGAWRLADYLRDNRKEMRAR
ncbi:UDP-N-acetylmuramoyl-tripeptide--D-alanyl-D-alanine ligase [Actinomyces sp. MRS3W]|uniref:UDP-N-acetylmuramoyl-tripeptide--D-alanyl-D- alanine ligase n=1 Tax=Actinomyces sp. MRS3W TaxID=2800796 RepID=UPI0028FDB47A|nr:UDP-N-acetylmuramoyl-tripeptide--D-alanyl-D-alanine ligase [Actinomyces sp. MRS3W]MDU0349146.1 UDP-N-acetylmuramoyl-tripeptide--D-alanyl-D-alanine ligase [Actinomyces sp. MRS3W]